MTQRVSTVLALLLLAATAAEAQVQTTAQRKCMGAADKAIAGIVDAQWNAARRCLTNAASGKLAAGQTAEECLVADKDGAVAKAIAKADQARSRLCSGVVPDFGQAAGAERLASAIAGALDGFEDLFGEDLGAAVVPSQSDKPAAACQASLATASGKALRAMLGEFSACKSAGLKDETIVSAGDLERCLAAIDSDAKGKIAKAEASLVSVLEQAGCSATLFPGTCSLAADFSECVMEADRCRSCEILVRANELTSDCDQFDDAQANLSCGSCAGADCDVNATCTSTGPVSHQCACNSGYSGDGVTCNPINSCLTDNGDCDPDATCTTTGPGTNSCACNSGYSGDGVTCEPIDSCLADNGGCDPHATCTSTGPGTNACACNPPYTGDGNTCSCTPVPDPPTLNGGYVTLKRTRISTGQVTTVNVTQPSVPSAQTLDNQRFTIEFNAGAFIDPAVCEDEPLQFQWYLSTLSVPGDYRVAGITGYDSSILSIDHDSLLGGNTLFTLRLVVTSTASPAMPARSTTYLLQVQAQSSHADIAIFNDCQDGSEVTPCSIPNLLAPG